MDTDNIFHDHDAEPKMLFAHDELKVTRPNAEEDLLTSAPEQIISDTLHHAVEGEMGLLGAEQEPTANPWPDDSAEVAFQAAKEFDADMQTGVFHPAPLATAERDIGSLQQEYDTLSFLKTLGYPGAQYHSDASREQL